MMALILVSMVGLGSAADITNSVSVTYDGMVIYGQNPVNVSVVAEEDATFKVYFTAAENDTDVTVEATLDTGKNKVYASTNVFDVEKDKSYRKTLTLNVPQELDEELSKDIELSVEISGKEYKTEFDIVLFVQRPSYKADVKSVVVPSIITAGNTIPVEIVLKNKGYNDLKDVYVTASVLGMGVSQGPKWFGEIVNIRNCSDDCENEDTVYGTMYLQIPYNAEKGIYALSVIVENDDTQTEVLKQIEIKNDFAQSVYSVGLTKDVKVGEEAVYELLVVNPTNKVKVYTIVPQGENVDSKVSQSILAVPAGSSQTVQVKASAKTEGSYEFGVDLISGNVIEETVKYQLNVEGNNKVNPVTILTIILAIIFVALLVALIVLLGKKPDKSEEIGESYY